MSIPAAIIGATGYVGGEALRLLGAHPRFELAAAVSDSRAGQTIAQTFPHLSAQVGDTAFAAHANWIEQLDSGSDVAVFSTMPHGKSAATIADALERLAQRNITAHVVDASADFRYSSLEAYEAVYGAGHGAPELIGEFASGLPEHVAGKPAEHVGNPGCFATAMLLASVPLLASGYTDEHLFITGITGSTGSGRSPSDGTHHPERHSNLYAYKPLGHRHAPEVAEMAAAASGVAPRLHFVPHSGPFTRGIYANVQAKLVKSAAADDVRDCFLKAYADCPFVRVVDGTPRVKNVVASNYAELGVAVDDDVVLVMSTIDNLVKGAAGGAMQWMNRLWGLPDSTGLEAVAPAWT
ncbi:MAG: N-acetyl-gamma-glutamyl-phosphate reductase [Pseudomonadota bacterium]